MPVSQKTEATPKRGVKLPTDLVDMLSGIVQIEGGTIADILDPLVRGPVTARYGRVKPALDKIRRLKAEHRSK